MYQQKSLSHWHAIQELQLKSMSMADMSGLLTKLQSRLQVKSMTFTLSSETRHVAENNLIKKAMDAFRERADIIRTSLEAPHYHIVSISVTTPEAGHRPFANVAAAREVTPPAMAAGTTEVAVMVSGAIQLPR
jgi:predicted secreted protein